MSTPAQRPEGELLERLRTEKRPILSARAAAKEADISPSRWTQITRGYKQETPDLRVPVRAPADTLARMARVVGATPSQLREVGREDAADELEALGERAFRVTAPAAGVGSDSAIARLSHALITTEQLSELLAAESQLKTAMSMLASADERTGLAVLVGARSTISGVIRQLTEAIETRGASSEGGRQMVNRDRGLQNRTQSDDSEQLRRAREEAALKDAQAASIESAAAAERARFDRDNETG